MSYPIPNGPPFESAASPPDRENRSYAADNRGVMLKTCPNNHVSSIKQGDREMRTEEKRKRREVYMAIERVKYGNLHILEEGADRLVAGELVVNRNELEVRKERAHDDGRNPEPIDWNASGRTDRKPRDNRDNCYRCIHCKLSASGRQNVVFVSIYSTRTEAVWK